MLSTLAGKSLFFFLLSVLFLILLTLFESSLSGLSRSQERLLSLLLLVLPALIGIILGIRSVIRREARLWMGLLGIALNTLFALFHLFVISFAG